MSGPPAGNTTFLTAQASPRALFAAGAALLPAFLLQEDITLRAALFCLFLVLNAASGRRIRLLQHLLVGAGIVVFNLVIPTGRVLFSVLSLAVTEGALKSGLYKSTAMIGLIALSQFSIRAELRFPGRIGGLLGTSLLYFERIMAEKRILDRRDIVGSVDAILLSVHREPVGPDPSQPRGRTSPGGAALLALVVMACWGALVWTFVHPRPIWGG